MSVGNKMAVKNRTGHWEGLKCWLDRKIMLLTQEMSDHQTNKMYNLREMTYFHQRACMRIRSKMDRMEAGTDSNDEEAGSLD